MRWTKKKPTKKGLYLRNNPVVRSVVRQIVIDNGNDRLKTQDGIMVPCFLEEFDRGNTFWWYGPIPPPPRTSTNK